VAVESKMERSMKVNWSGVSWGYSRRRITGGVEGCGDGLVSGGEALRNEAC
jgi:hypothetical protein